MTDFRIPLERSAGERCPAAVVVLGREILHRTQPSGWVDGSAPTVNDLPARMCVVDGPNYDQKFPVSAERNEQSRIRTFRPAIGILAFTWGLSRTTTADGDAIECTFLRAGLPNPDTGFEQARSLLECRRRAGVGWVASTCTGYPWNEGVPRSRRWSGVSPAVPRVSREFTKVTDTSQMHSLSLCRSIIYQWILPLAHTSHDNHFPLEGRMRRSRLPFGSVTAPSNLRVRGRTASQLRSSGSRTLPRFRDTTIQSTTRRAGDSLGPHLRDDA